MSDEPGREFGATMRFGVVAQIDAATCRVKVRLPDCGGMITGWLAVLHLKTHLDKHFHLPDAGEHVLCLLDARGEDGAVLGATYSKPEPPPVASVDQHHIRFADGTTVDYNRASHVMAIHAVGPIVIIAAGAVTIQAPSVTLDTPQTLCTGALTVQGATTLQGGLTVSGGHGAAATITGAVNVEGSVTASGSIQDGGGNSDHHVHS